MIGALDQAHHAGILQSQFFEEHLAVFIVLYFSDFRFCLGGDDQDFRILFAHRFADRIHIGIALGGGGIVHVADIHHRFIGKQIKLLGHLLLVGIQELHATAVLALVEGGLVTEQQLQEFLGFLIAAGRGLFLHLCDAGFDHLQILDLQFRIHHFLVADRIHTAVHVDHVAIVKTAEHVQDGIGFADVGQELVAQAFPLAGALYQTGDIHDIDRGGHDALGLAHLGQHFQPFIGHVGGTQVRLDGTEREIGALGLARAHAVEKGRLAHIRQSHNPAL